MTGHPSEGPAGDPLIPDVYHARGHMNFHTFGKKCDAAGWLNDQRVAGGVPLTRFLLESVGKDEAWRARHQTLTDNERRARLT